MTINSPAAFPFLSGFKSFIDASDASAVVSAVREVICSPSIFNLSDTASDHCTRLILRFSFDTSSPIIFQTGTRCNPNVQSVIPRLGSVVHTGLLQISLNSRLLKMRYISGLEKV